MESFSGPPSSPHHLLRGGQGQKTYERECSVLLTSGRHDFCPWPGGLPNAVSLGRHLIILWLFTVWPPSTGSWSLWASHTLPIPFRYVPACRFLLLGLFSWWFPVRVCFHHYSSSLVLSVAFTGPTGDSCVIFLPGRGNELPSSAVHFLHPKFSS